IFRKVNQVKLKLFHLRTGCGFGTQDTTSPTPNIKAYLFISVIVVGLDGFNKFSQCTFILTEEKKKEKTQYRETACFPVHQSSQSGLALYNAVWDAHLAAQSREENHKL
uniref:Uncharacterized protein n=1 Tax=Cyprinodon variegatus TaxID=28743 RepID=A0A3Q2GL39_CYPVA